MSDARNPFELDLDSVHKWLDYIHDRIGDDQLYKPPSKVPKYRHNKQEYDTYLNNVFNVGAGKFPKVSEKSPDSYRSTFDFHAEEGGKLSPLARLWITQDQRKRKEKQNNDFKLNHEEEHELDVSPNLCEMIKGNLSFDLKFRIISMIPSTSKIVRRYDNKLWSELFHDDYSIDCQIKDSAFVTFHKYRIISKEFNNRMQKKLMELDSLNLAKVFGMGETPKFLELNLIKISYLLSFINTKRKYILGKSKDVDNIDIYQDFPRIHSCLRSCYAEMNNLLILNTGGGTLFFNSSIAYYSNYKNSKEIDEFETITETKEKIPIYQNKDTEEFGDMFVEPEYLPKPYIVENEEEHCQIIDNSSHSTSDINRHNFESLVFKSEEHEKVNEYKMRAIRNKSLEFKEIPNDDLSLEFDNNLFEKTKLNELTTLFPNGKLPFIVPHEISLPIRENYFNVLIRRKLRRDVPELFSTIYDDNITLFKSLTLSSQVNPYNNIILNLILENGKEIPEEVDEDLLLSKSFRKNEITEITFVDFFISQLFCIFRNPHQRGRKDFGFGKMSLFSKEKIEFKEVIKNAVCSSFENNISKINLLFYGRYCYTMSDEIELLCSHFPNLKEIRLGLRLSSLDNQTAADILQNTSVNFTGLKDLLSYDLNKIILRAMDANSKIISSEDMVDGETVNINPLFEKTKCEDNCLYISFSSITNFEKHEIESIEKEIGIDLIRYPIMVIDLFKKIDRIEKSKDFADIFLERGLPESYFFDHFDNYSEYSRIFKEYFIYRRKVSNTPILRKETSYSTFYDNVIFDIYFGLDLISNPIDFEKSSLAPFGFLSVNPHEHLGAHNIIFAKLFFAKLFYENADTDMFIYFLDQHLNLQTDKETIEKAEKCSNSESSIELTYDNRIMKSFQIFFRYICKPKDHPHYLKQKATFNLDKLFSYLALTVMSRNYFGLVEALLTLGQNVFPNFNEVFTKSLKTDVIKSKPSSLNSVSLVVEETLGCMFEYETKLERRKEFLKMMYHEGITDPETKISTHILDNRRVQDKLLAKSTTLLHLLSKFDNNNVFLLYAIETMTPSQLMVQDSWGNTCLHVLEQVFDVEIYERNIDIYEKIVQKQPEIVNVLNNDLNSVLHILAYSSFPSLFTVGKLLVEKYGADKNLVNSYGLTAYEIAMFTISEYKSINHEKYYDLSFLLPTHGQSKKDLFLKMISNKKMNK